MHGQQNIKMALVRLMESHSNMELSVSGVNGYSLGSVVWLILRSHQ